MNTILTVLLAAVTFFGVAPVYQKIFNPTERLATKLVFKNRLPEASSNIKIPKKYTTAPIPAISAPIFFLFDPKSKTILAEQESEKVWPIASLTKLMTALVSLDFYPQWDKAVQMKERWFRFGGFEYWRVGDEATVRDLFNMSLAASSNTATIGLAEQSELPQDEFIRRMNDKALKLQMYHTHFSETTGLEPSNVSTAREYANLVRVALEREEIRRAVSLKSYELGVPTGPHRAVKVTNALLTRGLDNPAYQLIGGKTGYLEESLYNMATLAEHENQELVVVVFGAKTSEERFNDVKKLIQWGFDNFKWQ